jgi:endo-1,4-beta-xylanase
MGNIIRNTNDFTNTTRFGILKRHYNIVTAENNMKPDHLAPSADPGSSTGNWNYRFTTADTIVNTAISAGFRVHGHTLIWHSQSPSWLADGGEDYLNKFVKEVIDHFKDRVFSWDVVNEAFRDDLGGANPQNWKDCLRASSGNPWLKMGPEYIEKAFLAARAADPKARLYYNDYSLNWNTNNNNANKAKAVFYMVEDINTRYPDVEGRPLIDGIGMQTHHHLNTDPQTVRESIRQFDSLGVEIAISEMDIQASKASTNNLTNSWDGIAAWRQAEMYAAMFRIFKEYSGSISHVIFWGIDDGTSWRAASHPTLFNSDYSLKPAFYAVSNPNNY